jgi:hypothetical protein
MNVHLQIFARIAEENRSGRIDTTGLLNECTGSAGLPEELNGSRFAIEPIEDARKLGVVVVARAEYALAAA